MQFKRGQNKQSPKGNIQIVENSKKEFYENTFNVSRDNSLNLNSYIAACKSLNEFLSLHHITKEVRKEVLKNFQDFNIIQQLIFIRIFCLVFSNQIKKDLFFPCCEKTFPNHEGIFSIICFVFKKNTCFFKEFYLYISSTNVQVSHSLFVVVISRIKRPMKEHEYIELIDKNLYIEKTKACIENGSYISFVKELNDLSGIKKRKFFISEIIEAYFSFGSFGLLSHFIKKCIKSIEDLSTEDIQRIVEKSNLNDLNHLSTKFPTLVNDIVEKMILQKRKKKEIVSFLFFNRNNAYVTKETYNAVIRIAQKMFVKFRFNLFLEHKYPNLFFDFTFENDFVMNVGLKILLRVQDLEMVKKMIKTAEEKNLVISEENKINIDKLNFDEKRSQEIKYKEDNFGPLTENCLIIDTNKTKVIFVDNEDTLEKYSEYFKPLEPIGIDTEWKSPLTRFEPTLCSIIQLCNYSEDYIMIIDSNALKKQAFNEKLIKFLTGRLFVGFSFESDITMLPKDISYLFVNKLSEVVDIEKLFLEKYPSKKKSCLKYVTQTLLNISLCKVEQCSNWNNRPLRQAQLHYAAMDALICIKIYKELIKEKS